MLPISDIPTPLREFAQQFRNVFKHPKQREYFEIILTGLTASENRTLAGIHQRLVKDIDYGGLHHFMTDSPWNHDVLVGMDGKALRKRFRQPKSYSDRFDTGASSWRSDSWGVLVLRLC